MLMLQYVFCGFFLSLLGSIPIGMITLTILARTIHAGKKAGIAVALGATVAEFTYTYIALKFLKLLLGTSMVSVSIKLVSLVLFIGLGVYYLKRIRNDQFNLKPPVELYQKQDFLKGLIVGFLNMLIIPFWLVVGAALEDRGLSFDDQQKVIVFSLAAAFGALVVFLLYVRMVKLISRRIEHAIKYTDRAVGVLFLGLAIFQIISLLS